MFDRFISDTKLNQIDSEDLFDTIVMLEKSFKIKFENDAFLEVKTFGDICTAFQKKIILSHNDSCTKQQAFYKIRDAISVSQSLDKDKIFLNSTIADIFPKKNRRKNIKAFETELGFKTNILTMRFWLFCVLAIGFIGSFIFLFLNWIIALIGFSVFYSIGYIAGRFSKELQINSIRDLVEQITVENYTECRRDQNTVNKDEIVKLIQTAFSKNHYLEIQYLQMDAKLF